MSLRNTGVTMTWADWDKASACLMAWREARGERNAGETVPGDIGMRAVLCVAWNRHVAANKSLGSIVTAPWQFSSLTAKGDPELVLWPRQPDAQFEDAMAMIDDIVAGTSPDITNGATHYFAKSMTTPPAWAAQMTQVAEIGNHKFFR